MVLTRGGEAACQALYIALAAGDTNAASIALLRHALPVAPDLGGLSALHWAAAGGCSDASVLAALAAAGAPADAPTSRLYIGWPPWVWSIWHTQLSSAQREALSVPGCTALAVAARLGHVATVQQLLALGADVAAVGPPLDGHPKPYTPLSAVVLTSGGSAAAARDVVAALLAAGADPLAPSVRRRCSTLRCACGSEFLPNGTLPLLLDHLEAAAAAGRLAFRSGDAAVDVMVAAARCCRLHLFRLAHEYVLAASGRRHAGGGDVAARALRPRPTDSGSSSEELGGDSGGGGGGDASSTFSGGGAEGEAADVAWLGQLGQLERGGAAPASWQPSGEQLFEVMRAGVLGGGPAILRCILGSALPFGVGPSDAHGTGLLAHCATHAAEASCGQALVLLAAAGARLTLRRLLHVLEKRMSPGVVAALLALQRPLPAVPASEATVKAAGVVSFTCPIHRVLHAWQRGTHPSAAADPGAWPSAVLRVLEVLRDAGYRPMRYRGLRQPVIVVGAGGVATPAPDPFDPFDIFPPSSLAQPRAAAPPRAPGARGVHWDRLLLVAQGGQWDTAAHAIWPPAFKAAVQTLLLAAHRLSTGGGASSGRPSRAERAARRALLAAGGPQAEAGGGGATLGALPQELLLRVAERAAFPMSAWM